MVELPIRVKRHPYHGSDPKKRMNAADYNRRAAKLEQVINEVVSTQDCRVKPYTWIDFAEGSRMSVEDIRELGSSIDGGHNGFTAIRRDLPE